MKTMMKKICNKCGQGHLVVPEDARPQMNYEGTGVEGYMWECKGIDKDEVCNSTLFVKLNKGE